MSVRTNENQREAEEEGAELTLVALTYTGSRSTYYAESLRDQGGYPSLDGFQNYEDGTDDGQTKLVKIPSGKLGWWERHADFRVDYTPAAIAETLLKGNYLPAQLVTPGADTEIRDLLLDKLDIEPAADEESYREQLREVAGMDEEEDEKADDENAAERSRADHLQSEYDRSTLITVAGSFDDIDERLEEWDVEQTTHAKNTELATYLAGKDNDTVDKRLRTIESGGNIE